MVVCAGAKSARLAASAHVYLPVLPLRGCSITAPLPSAPTHEATEADAKDAAESSEAKASAQLDFHGFETEKVASHVWREGDQPVGVTDAQDDGGGATGSGGGGGSGVGGLAEAAQRMFAEMEKRLKPSAHVVVKPYGLYVTTFGGPSSVVFCIGLQSEVAQEGKVCFTCYG